jgi:putative transposase
MGKLTHRTAAGSTYFITTDAWQKRSVFQVTETAEIVVQRILACRDNGSYLLHEFVLMPDHLHLLITPGYEMSLEKAIQLIKGGSSFLINKSRGAKMEIWQSGFHDWTIRDGVDFEAKAQYIRANPVVAKLVERCEDWGFGSASGRFRLDPKPERIGSVAAGAKAPSTTT